MKVRPLVINDASRAEIRRVVVHAEANPISLNSVVRSMGKPELSAGDNSAHVCVLPFGFRCVFSIEEQPIGKCRHLSVSVLGDGAAPNEFAVEMLMKEFGFRGGLRDANGIYTEDIEPGKVAVNVLQSYEPKTH